MNTTPTAHKVWDYVQFPDDGTTVLFCTCGERIYGPNTYRAYDNHDTHANTAPVTV